MLEKQQLGEMSIRERASYEGLIAEVVPCHGHQGDTVHCYFARPLGSGPYPGIVVIHHAPGWDEATKEITRKSAAHGHITICPNLHYREGPTDPVEAAATIRTGARTCWR